jgi:hypothetical protein
MLNEARLHNEELFELAWRVAQSAREHVRRLQREERYLGHHHDFPVLGEFNSGVPQVSFNSGDKAPTDYSGPFGVAAGKWTAVGFEELDGFEELLTRALAHEVLRERLHFAPLELLESEFEQRFARIAVAGAVLGAFDHVWHLVGEAFTASDFRDAWRPIEARLVQEQLGVQICVPIALTKFVAEEAVELAAGLRLVRIPDEVQLARVPQYFAGAAVESSVLGGATHALVLSGYTMPGDPVYKLRSHEPGFYPLAKIELVFEALRLAAEVDTGYAQVFLNPLDWVPGYTGPLRNVDRGAILRRYPPQFDNFGWLREPRVVTADDVRIWTGLLAALESAPPPLRLGSRRLSMAMLREEEADAVVDVCIGLEAALGDASPSEMTHKLALRTAGAMCAVEGKEADAAQIFNQVKRLYDWRSKIVHGLSDEEKSRARLEATADGVPARAIATGLLRRALGALLHHGEPLHGSLVDTKLILPALAGEP